MKRPFRNKTSLFQIPTSSKNEARSAAETEGANNHLSSATKPNVSTDTDTSTSRVEATTDIELSASVAALVHRETSIAKILRICVIVFLAAIGAMFSIAVYKKASTEEQELFVANFQSCSFQVLNSFTDVIESNLGAIGALSTYITSHALESNLTFPFVTVPNYELVAAQARVQSGSYILWWMPLVTNENRLQWEAFAMANRYQIDEAYDKEVKLRTQQDIHFGHAEASDPDVDARDNSHNRQLQEHQNRNETVLDDGTYFHPRIWSNGAAPGSERGDEPEGSEPYYFPAWQRSPVDQYRQGLLNVNGAKTRGINHVYREVVENQTAAMNSGVVPIPEMKPVIKQGLDISQYRGHDGLADDLVDSLQTWVAYPVFDKLVEDDESNQRQVVGILGAGFYWNILLSNLLPESHMGIICVLENSYNQTFTYRVDGPKATFLGMGDLHNPRYDYLEEYENINSYLEERASVQNHAYNAVNLNKNVGQYTIRVYPSETFEVQYVTTKPAVFVVVVLSAFLLAAMIFVLFSVVVEKRHSIVMSTAIENALKARDAEIQLNEFLSHEIRNPLSAAISACCFASSSIEESSFGMMTKPTNETVHKGEQPNDSADVRKTLLEDLNVIHSSLNFINDFLRSMLDIHRASRQKLQLKCAATDLLKDVLEPVAAMFCKRSMLDFDILVDCPPNCIVMADSLRLKQVVLNLVRNSSKFVEHGYIKMRVAILSSGIVQIYVEDTGPGVPEAKKETLFSKYQESLDSLSQGTGIGLNLSKQLMVSMNGDLIYDDSFHSGIENCPGTRFIVDLNVPLVDVESAFGIEESTRTTTETTFLEENTSFRTTNTIDSGGQCRSNFEASTYVDSLTATIQRKDLPDSLSILFVDDEVVLRKLFVRAAKKLGGVNWTVQEASSGESAIQLCEPQAFDIIFIDQYMASVHKQLLGTETIRKLRQVGVQSRICGLSANDLGKDFLAAGANYFVMKPMPCKPDELRQVFVKALYGGT